MSTDICPVELIGRHMKGSLWRKRHNVVEKCVIIDIPFLGKVGWFPKSVGSNALSRCCIKLLSKLLGDMIYLLL